MDNCRTSIVDFHRYCPVCSYELSLMCCQEIREGNLQGGCDEVRSPSPKREIAYMLDGELLPESLHEDAKNFLNPSTVVWKAYADGSIPCPPKEIGGCGASRLELKCMLPENWVFTLEAKAEALARYFELQHVSVETNCDCSISDNNSIRALSRESEDNLIYNPLSDESQLRHFQAHWRQRQPVIVHDVLEKSSCLSWELLVMWRAMKNGKLHRDRVNAIDCLACCEVDISCYQFFQGYMKGWMYVNLWPEMLKLKDWPTSDQFDKCLPRHGSAFEALPFETYSKSTSWCVKHCYCSPEGHDKARHGAKIIYGIWSC